MRLVVTAAAVALGVGLLLVTVAGINAVQAQNRRIAWLNTSSHNLRPSVDEATSDPLWATAALDEYRGSIIQRIDVAGTGSSLTGSARDPRPTPRRAVLRLPGPGPTPAHHPRRRAGRPLPRSPGGRRRAFGARLAELARHHHRPHRRGALADSGGARGPKHRDGSAGYARGPAPRSDRVHPGGRRRRLVAAGAHLHRRGHPPGGRRGGSNASPPCASSAPPRRQVSIVAAAEACVRRRVCGVVGGFGLFFLLRSPLVGVPFTGQPFFPGDLSLGPLRHPDHRDRCPDRGGRRRPPRAAAGADLPARRDPPSRAPARRAWRVDPAAGRFGRARLLRRRRPGHRPAARSSPTARAPARHGRARHRRTLDHPADLSHAGAQHGDRPSSSPGDAYRTTRPRFGRQRAHRRLFIATTTVGIITTIVAYHSASTGRTAGRDILYAELADGSRRAGYPGGRTSTDSLTSRLTSIRGVRAVTVVHADQRLVQGRAPAPDWCRTRAARPHADARSVRTRRGRSLPSPWGSAPGRA